MTLYRCEYQNMKKSKNWDEMKIEASDEMSAYEKFVQQLKKDGWSIQEVLNHSKLRIVDTETSDLYKINAYGELTSREGSSW